MSNDIKNRTGLSQDEAKIRLVKFGPNELYSSQFKSGLREWGKLFLDPMGLILIGLAVLYIILGEKTEAIILLIAWVPITAVNVILEMRTNAALKALKSTLTPTAKILREGIICDVLIRQIVPGDLLIFKEGQMLPADGVLVEAQNLMINESALTGESIPVEKLEGHEFFGGTQVLSGRGLGIIEKTGQKTRFGKIAKLLETVEVQFGPLKKKVDALIRKIVILAGLLVVFLFVLEVIRTGHLFRSLLVALTFGMAAVPEEFPLVFTLYLGLGVWRLSKKRVLVKSLPSVESLGSVDVLCTDKTGTLTQGHFQLEEIYSFDNKANKNQDSFLWSCALMACEPRPVDSMEISIFEKGQPYLGELQNWQLVWDYPFEQKGKHMTHVWKNSKTKIFRTVMKGAVEGIIEHCQINESERLLIDGHVHKFASQGKRLLALAMKEGEATGDRQIDEKNLKYLGILVFSDPIRPSVSQSIIECQSNGIEIKMLTGDHALTAHYIADQSGIEHNDQQLFTGEELGKMDLASRKKAFVNGRIFSRVQPEQKHEMIKILRAQGRVVAMVGDGINDAPALKLADIGISMGHNATDVARSSAQIVLVDSDFSGIVAAILEGRKIFSNLKKSFSYLISFHVPIIFLTLIPSLFSWEALLMPIHIIFLELIVHPISAFTFENLKVSKNKDQEQTKKIMDLKTFLRSFFSGIFVTIGCLFLYRYLSSAVGVDTARTSSFLAILMGNIAFVTQNIWPQFEKRYVITLVIIVLLILLLALVPFAAFHFTSVGFEEFSLAMIVGALGFIPPSFQKLSRLYFKNQIKF